MLFSLTKRLYKLSYNVQWIREQRTVGLNFHRVIYYPTSYGTILGFLYYNVELFFVRKKPRPSEYWVSYGWKPCKPTLFVDLQIYWRTVYEHALKDHRCTVWNIQQRAAASVLPCGIISSAVSRGWVEVGQGAKPVLPYVTGECLLYLYSNTTNSNIRALVAGLARWYPGYSASSWSPLPS